MKLPRRSVLHLGAGAVALPAALRIASAQTHPARPVRIVVGYPAGSTADIIGRLIGHWLTDSLGQQFIIDNRPGAGSNVAAELVVHAAPDGDTLLWITAANAINATLYENLKFDFIRDIAAVASISRTAHLVVVNPNFPAQSVAELIADAKANPGKIGMASGGIGTTSHIAGALFEAMTGVNLNHVPYRGDGPALNDLIAGQVQVMFVPTQVSIELVRAGKLRALAVTTAQRQAVLPELPPVADFVPGYEASGWIGIGVPRDTPAEIVAKLNKAVNAGLADPQLKARLTDLGGEPMPMLPAEFDKFIADETEKWGKVIRAANIKVE